MTSTVGPVHREATATGAAIRRTAGAAIRRTAGAAIRRTAGAAIRRAGRKGAPVAGVVESRPRRRPSATVLGVRHRLWIVGDPCLRHAALRDLRVLEGRRRGMVSQLDVARLDRALAGRLGVSRSGRLAVPVAVVAYLGLVVAMMHMRVARDGADPMVVMHDVVMPVRIEHPIAGTEPVPEGDRADVGEGDAPAPVVTGAHRRPANIRVTRLAGPPHHPCRSVRAARDPGPAATGHVGPAAVVKRDVAPVVIADPNPVAIVGHRPAAVRAVRLEVATDDHAVGNPNRAPGRIVDPGAVRLERLTEFRQRAGVGIGLVIVTVRLVLG